MKVVFTLVDGREPKEKLLTGEFIQTAPGLLELRFAGYGEKDAADGDGAPILIDWFNGRLSVIIGRDINSDSQEIISLEDARESLRKQSQDEC